VVCEPQALARSAIDGNLQPFDDGLPLVRDSLSLQRLAFRFRLGLLDHQNLVKTSQME
jgi:hypothetical protein